MARKAFVAEHIAAVPMFVVCTRKELQTITRLATELDVAAGKTLTQEGKPGQEFMIVLDGTAIATKNGKKIATFGPGDYFGEIALLDPGVRTATIVAQTPMELAVIAASDFGAALDEVPALARKIMRGLARRLREVDDSEVV